MRDDTARTPLLLVVNPRATRFSPARLAAVLDTLAAAYLVHRVDSVAAESEGRLARRAESIGATTVVALGGDGTLNRVCSSLCHTSVRLGVIPAGAGNVLARSLGIPTDQVVAARLLVDRLAPPVAVRLAAVVSESRTDRALTQVGLGLEADVVARAHAARPMRPTVVRLASAAIREVRQRDKRRFTVSLDGAAPVTAWSAAVQTRYPYTWLGRVPVGMGEPAAGRCSVLVLAPSGWVRAYKDVTEVVVTPVEEAPVAVHVDGEPAGHTRGCRVTVGEIALWFHGGPPRDRRRP